MEPFRVLPRLDDKSGFFWTSGRDGVLRFLCCSACDYLIHPPSPRCPRCWSRAVEPRGVSGLATVHSFTVNHQRWAPDIEEPYVIGLVEIDEQDDVRLTTNIVNVAPESVAIGMPVRVTFEDHDPIFIPLFEPAFVSAGEPDRPQQ